MACDIKFLTNLLKNKMVLIGMGVLLVVGIFFAVRALFSDYQVEITDEYAELVADYEMICGYSEGYATVLKNGKYGFIDTKGESIVRCKYDAVAPFLHGLAAVMDEDKVGFIDTNGKEVIPCKYYNQGEVHYYHQ
jgi:hypothetical protein